MATSRIPTTKNWGNRPWTIDFHSSKRDLPPSIDFAVVGVAGVKERFVGLDLVSLVVIDDAAASDPAVVRIGEKQGAFGIAD